MTAGTRPTPKSIELGLEDILYLDAIPKTSIALEKPELVFHPSKPACVLTLKGTCTNIESGTACDICLDVSYDRDNNPYNFKSYRLESKPGTMTVHPDKKFEVKLHTTAGDGPILLNLDADRLVGKGMLKCTIDVAIPHCEKSGGEGGVWEIPFDNQLVFKLTPKVPGDAQHMGAEYAVTPSAPTGAFKNIDGIELEIQEYDAPGTDELANPKDLSSKISWTLAQLDSGVTLHWHVGCALIPGEEDDHVSLLYPEEGEAEPYEFRWTARARKNGEIFPLAIRDIPLVDKVPKPKLKTFEVAVTPAREGGFNAKMSVQFGDFAKGIRFPIALSIWQPAPAPANALSQVGGPWTIDYDTDAASLEHAEHIGLATTKNLFAVLEFKSVPAMIAGGEHSLPLSAIVDYGKRRVILSGPHATFSTDHWAGGICSSGASKLKLTPLLDQDRVRSVMWATVPAVKAKLQQILDGAVTPGAGRTPSCDKAVDTAIRAALAALNYPATLPPPSIPKVTWDSYLWTNKAFGWFLSHDGVGSPFRHLLIDRDHKIVEDSRVAAFTTPALDLLTEANLDAIPIVPITRVGFEVLLHALAESS